MFENLSDKLERAFKVLKGQGQITEINVAETMKEVRRALLDADVEVVDPEVDEDLVELPLARAAAPHFANVNYHGTTLRAAVLGRFFASAGGSWLAANSRISSNSA